MRFFIKSSASVGLWKNCGTRHIGMDWLEIAEKWPAVRIRLQQIKPLSVQRLTGTKFIFPAKRATKLEELLELRICTALQHFSPS